MGEARKDALRVDFNRKLKLEFCGARVTSDAGLLAYRELDEAMQLTYVALSHPHARISRCVPSDGVLS